VHSAFGNLQIDCIDLYQAQTPSLALIKQGKVCAIGTSNFTSDWRTQARAQDEISKTLTHAHGGVRVRCHSATAPKGRPFWVSGCAPC
jgi:hypothetical protein